MPKLTEVQQAVRRARILDAAEVCFARAGFHRTTMQDICREAGVSAGGVYLYFASKEALIDGIVGRDREEIVAELSRVGGSPDLMAGLEGLLRTCVLERPTHKSRLYLEMLSEAGRTPDIARIVSTCETTLNEALAGMLEDAQRAGRIAAHVDPRKAARLMLVIGDGLFISLARHGQQEAARVTPDVLSMISQYLTGAQPAAEPTQSNVQPMLAEVAE